MSLFEMVDFAPPKPAHAQECRYCFADNDGIYPELAFHEREHLSITCSVCGEAEPNRLLFGMNHGGAGWLSPVKCTALSLRLNHLTYALLHGKRPEDRDMRAIDLGWRIAPDGAQIPPADWNVRHPARGGFPDQVYLTHSPGGSE